MNRALPLAFGYTLPVARLSAAVVPVLVLFLRRISVSLSFYERVYDFFPLSDAWLPNTRLTGIARLEYISRCCTVFTCYILEVEKFDKHFLSHWSDEHKLSGRRRGSNSAS
jgi:hypothetical protein